jgi:hypothetical protein
MIVLQSGYVSVMTRTVDLTFRSREGLLLCVSPVRYLVKYVQSGKPTGYKSCAGISLAGTKPNTTSEQPLIQAGDSVIVNNEGACDFEFIITRTRVEPRDIVPGIYNYAGDFLMQTGNCKTGFCIT